MFERAPQGGSEWGTPKAGDPALLGPEPVIAPDRRCREEGGGNPCSSAPPKGERVGQAEGRGTRPLLGPEPVIAPDRRCREEGGRKPIFESAPQGGDRVGQAEGRGAGRSSRTPAARLRRCRPIRMTSQEANPC